MATRTSSDIVSQHKNWKRSNPLREWRTENGVTIHEAASIIGCSMTSVQLWESGSASPGPKYRARLTKIIGPNFERRWNAWEERNPSKNL